MNDFPPNSERSREEPIPQPEEKPKVVGQVTANPATRRKKTLGRKFTGMFFGGDVKTARNYVAFEVLLPAARDMIYEAGASMIERIIFGDSRRRRWSPPPYGMGPMQQQGPPQGYVSYNRYAMGQRQPERALSRRARAQHDFDEIILDSRSEAETVIEQLFELVSQYDSASVADLYSLVGLTSTHVDLKWGWTDMRGASATKIRGGGYVLDLPPVQSLN